MAKSRSTLAAEYEALADAAEARILEMMQEGVQVVQFDRQRFELLEIDKLQDLATSYRTKARRVLRKTHFVLTSPRRL